MTAPTPCGRCGTPLADSDLRCCICALAVPARKGGAAPTAIRARIQRCRECAAAISYNAEVQAPHCSFCGSTMDIEEPEDPIEVAEWIVPFAVDRPRAQGALSRWQKSLGWFRPGDLSSSSTVESLEPLHWAAWVFDADAQVSWAADSDAGSRRSAWAPHAGQTAFTWRNILVSASRGLTRKETGSLASGYRLDSAVAIEGDRPPDAPGAMETFDTQRSAARRTIVESIEHLAAADIQGGGFIPGSRYRNVNASVLLSQLYTRRYVLPAWVLAYRYKGTLYRSIVHGQDEAVVVGEAPYSWTKIFAVIAVAVAAVLIIAAMIAA